MAARTLTPCEGDPPRQSGRLAPPAGHHQEAAGDGEGDDAQDDEEEREDPLRGQPRGDAGPVPAVDDLALLDQTHSQGAWMETGGKGRGSETEEKRRIARTKTRAPLLADRTFGRKGV